MNYQLTLRDKSVVNLKGRLRVAIKITMKKQV